VNQRRERVSDRHRIRQPDVQRYLRALSGRTDKQQHRDRRRATGNNRSGCERIDGVF
jgi:hypothetical protein